jgi:predicted N-acetyltransferase YhbS
VPLATSDDRPGIEAHLRAHEWDVKDLDRGDAFVERDDGEIVGLVRVIPVEPGTWVIDDVLVKSDRRGKGIGAELMREAMAGRDGELLLVCHGERLAFYGRLGFTEAPKDELGGPALEYLVEIGDLPDTPDHAHHLMRGTSIPSSSKS